MEWIAPSIIVVVAIGLFVAGWILGGRNREKNIRIKGLEDVKEAHEKLSEDLKSVDSALDNTASRLGLRNNSSRRPKVLPAK
jgi:hypothetical protein